MPLTPDPVQMPSTIMNPIIKQESVESSKRKREDNDYDVP